MVLFVLCTLVMRGKLVHKQSALSSCIRKQGGYMARNEWSLELRLLGDTHESVYALNIPEVHYS